MMKKNKKSELVTVKVSEKDKKFFLRLSKKHFDGNVSELIRHSVTLFAKGGQDAASQS